MAENENNISGKVGMDTTDFKSGIAELNRQIKVIDSGFKAAAAGMGQWGSTAEGLQMRIDSLNSRMDLQRKKVEALKNEYKRIADEKGADSRAAQELQIRINRETEALNKNEYELKQVTRALDEFGKETNDASDKASKFHGALGKMGSALKSAGGATARAAAVSIAAVGAASAAAVTGAFKLAEKASDLAEAQNVVKETFDNTSDSVLAWSKTVAQSAGISETNAVKFVGSMGAMLKSSGVSEDASASMAESLVQLTGDMSSFYNLDHDEAWNKIRSGISGETEPLKQLGINMSVANLEAYALTQGITKSFKSMTQGEQTQLRYQYLMQATADAQGDFGRTLETSFPNQLRVAQMQMESMATSVGQKFLPSFLDIFRAVNTGFSTGDWSSVGTSISKGLNEVIGQVSSMAITAAPVAASVIGGIASALAEAVPQILPALVDVALTVIGSLSSMLKDNGPMMINAGIDALTTLIDGIVTASPQLIDVALTLIMALVDGLLNNAPKIVESAVKLISALIQGLINALPQIVAMAPMIITTLIETLMANLPLIIASAANLIGALITGIAKSLPALLTTGPKILATIGSSILKINWGKLGLDIMAGIGKGIAGAGGAIASAAGDALSGALSSVKKLFGIQSPSKVFEKEVGAQLGAGMAIGITKSAKQVNAAMNGLNTQLQADLKIGTSNNLAIAGTGLSGQSGVVLHKFDPIVVRGVNDKNELIGIVNVAIEDKMINWLRTEVRRR